MMTIGERTRRPATGLRSPSNSYVEVSTKQVYYPIMRVMEPADSITRLGFSRWYERQLIEGHAWFVSGFVCMVAVAACVEEITFRGSPGRQVLYAIVASAAVAIGIYGLARYHRILGEAERLGEHATCGGCGAYARFQLVSSSNVRCRRCGNEWQLIEPA